MTNTEYIDRSVDMIRKEWFREHRVARVEYLRENPKAQGSRFLGPHINTLEWANPTTSNYLVMYFLHRAALFITGDIGHAIYRWSPDPEITLQWISRCNYSYFAETLEGIDGNQESTRWDGHVCELRAIAFLKEHGRKPKIDWQSYTSHREEWNRFLWDEPAIFKPIGNDAHDWGLVPNNRVIGHWLGLRMAIDQLG